jgi:hypothetical protein
MKKLALVLFIPIFSCSPISNINSNNLLLENNQYVAQLSPNNGAKFTVKIDFNSGLKVKSSISGTEAKLPNDITKIDLYLLKLPSGFTGTDPLGTNNNNLIKSFIDIPKSGSTFSMTFKNVPGLDNPNQYWIGVVAKDNSGIISKKPSIAWTGSTASIPALSLSSGGIGVNSTTFAVSSTNDISVTVPLLDAVGAQIGTKIDTTSGNTALPDSNIEAY